MKYTIAKYLLILNPHEALQHKILSVKQAIKEKYALTSNLSRPHIMLAKFFTWEMMEEKIKHSINGIGMGIAPFKVDLKNCGSFPTHTIYINVTTKNAIQQLVKKIRSAQRLMKSPDHKPHFMMEPYIAIAQKLTDLQYAQSWPEYAHRHFSGSFIADSMLLLKQKEGERKYEIVQRFAFQNLPIRATQGDLFV